jgi:hypothetical protein
MKKVLQHTFTYWALIVGVLFLYTIVVGAEDSQHPQNKTDSRCELEAAHTEVNQQVEAVSRRLGPYLSALAKYCSGPLGNDLAKIAKQAAEQPTRAQRSTMLANAASKILSTDCRTDQPLAAASNIHTRCPGPDLVGLHRNIAPLKDLDVGSYLFILAVHERLYETSLRQNNLRIHRRYLQNMVLSGALEGCKARGCSDLPTVYITP